jgi:hypothetical protein
LGHSLPWSAYSMVPYDFLMLFPQLVCQAPRSKATLTQLLGTSGGRGSCKKLQPPQSHPNSVPTKGGGKTNRCDHAQGCKPLGTTGMPAIAKRIHREGPTYIQSRQPHIVVTPTFHHFL